MVLARLGSAAPAANSERALRKQIAWRGNPSFRRFTDSQDDSGLKKEIPAKFPVKAGGILMKLEGGCYCRALRYVAEGEPVMKAQCHCRECQYITGGAPNVIVAMPTAGFTYTKGTPKTYTRSDLQSPVTREFCAECGTHIAARPPGFPAVTVKVGTLDDPSLFSGPDLAIYTVDKQRFHQIPQGLPSFERLPG
jgi:hypothetical protein